MSNSRKLSDALRLISAVQADLKEKLSMISAEETHGDPDCDPDREDDFLEALEKLDEAEAAILDAEEKL